MSPRLRIKTRQKEPQQFEVCWPEPESFALVIQHALDGDRVAKEVAQRVADREASNQQQTQFPL
jgi:hypothetical protein